MPPRHQLVWVLLNGLVLVAVDAERHGLEPLVAQAADGKARAVWLHGVAGPQLVGDGGEEFGVEHDCCCPIGEKDLARFS